MAGIYFHIPFCKRMCGYCDFVRTTVLRHAAPAVARMEEELVQRAGFVTDRCAETIYFGGGTPSVLPAEDIARLIARTREVFDCSAVREITVEMNPDDVTPEYARRLMLAGVNRISLGVQSLDDRALQFMGRRHTAAGARQAVATLQGEGVGNISADMIFGLPAAIWDGSAAAGADALRRTLDGMLTMGVQHISAYHLTIEDDTRFGRMAARGGLTPVPEEQSEREYAEVHRALTAAGFEHYEVSNYALPGFRSQHNSAYWTGAQYLGIGPGAHSYNGGERCWCTSTVEEYAGGGAQWESERLSPKERQNEYVMTSLRRAEGLSMPLFRQMFGNEAAQRLLQSALPFIRAGIAVDEEGERIRIASDKFLVSDAVISTLFEV